MVSNLGHVPESGANLPTQCTQWQEGGQQRLRRMRPWLNSLGFMREGVTGTECGCSFLRSSFILGLFYQHTHRSAV